MWNPSAYRALIFASSACRHRKLLILLFQDRSLPTQTLEKFLRGRMEICSYQLRQPLNGNLTPSHIVGGARLNGRCAGKLKAVCFNYSCRCDVSLLGALMASGNGISAHVTQAAAVFRLICRSVRPRVYGRLSSTWKIRQNMQTSCCSIIYSIGGSYDHSLWTHFWHKLSFKRVEGANFSNKHYKFQSLPNPSSINENLFCFKMGKRKISRGHAIF